MLWHEVVGIAGTLLYVTSYGSVQSNLMDGNGRAYAALNLLAAVLVLVSLNYSFNLPSALIQASWIVLSVLGLLRHRAPRRDQSLPLTASSGAPRPGPATP
ncbi:MAG: hypothetical protein K0U93_14830 [Gammaproteobacteria bacterium]|nr:hypothetical protein [Gammaproteobacteria bacterium]